MTRPHEEEWYQSSPGTVRVRNEANTLVGAFANSQREKLAIAAPRLARALLEELSDADDSSQRHTQDCSYAVTVGGAVKCSSPRCRRVRAALREAGSL